MFPVLNVQEERATCFTALLIKKDHLWNDGRNSRKTASKRARPGFEPGTSRTRSENHTPRPTSHPETEHFVSSRRARPGFEPGTSRTLSENHTPRPTSHPCLWLEDANGHTMESSSDSSMCLCVCMVETTLKAVSSKAADPWESGRSANLLEF
ncbi:hypothetical protein QQF64_003185 [Cirrhinus molitorella]|uniref:Uncharacterized protein n=1 Tax=Cirrhinus molitorella TaxID=172907 RepID=A0ABR3MKY4_9TELE